MAKAKATRAVLNPLNENDLAGAKAIIETADQLDAYLDACEDCGVEFGPIREQAAAYREFAKGVIRNFGGNASNAS